MAIKLRSQEARDELRDLVVDKWIEMKGERDQLEGKWKRCLSNYLCEFDKAWVDYAKAGNRSHRFVSLGFDAVETLTPQIYSAIAGRDDSIKVRPIREGGDSERDDQIAMNMHFLLKHQMRQGKYDSTLKTAIKQMLVLGNCPWWLDWKVIKAVDYGQFADAMSKWAEQAAMYYNEHEQILAQHRELVIRAKLLNQPVPPMPAFDPPPEPPRDLDIVFEGPVLRIGSIFNYVQEQHPNDPFNAMRIMRSWRTKAYLKRAAQPDRTGYRLYEGIDGIHEMESESRTRDNEAEALMKAAVGMQLPTTAEKVLLKEMHGTFELKGGGGEKGIYENWVVTVANDNQLIRAEPSPFFSGRPIVQNARLIKYEGLVYGFGVLEKALDEADSVNAIHNQNVDAANSVIQPEYEVVEDQLAEGHMRKSGPGVRHNVTAPGTITPITKNFQGIPLGINLLNAAIQRHERITGAIDTSSGSSETATRTQRNTNIISGKLMSHVEEVEAELVNESLNMAMEMNAQYIEDDVILAVTQDEKSSKVTVSPHEIRRGWIVYSAGSKYLAEKQDRIQNTLMAIQMAEQREAAGVPSPVKTHKLWRRLFKDILGEGEDMVMDADEYEALMAEHRAMMAQQQMAARQGGGGGQEGQEGAGQGGGSRAPGPAGAMAPGEEGSVQ